MNISELDSYNLADAVRFHDRLNSRLWDRSEHLHPEVKAKLMTVARDFQEFLGVPDLDIRDITISGSNAAYNYTENSDIDLHLVVSIPQVKHDEVYRELFNAKKYQYNDEHDIRIGGADVELYAQPIDQPHHSQGIYSLLRNTWVSVPRRHRAKIDDASVRAKYEDLVHRIDDAVASENHDRIANLQRKIKTMRQAGLEQQGEFGVDNIVFKLLRVNGFIKKLIDARNRARDRELSLLERRKKKSRVRYGFGGYYTPGFSFGDSGEGGGDGGGGESRAMESPDGVSPSTRMFLSEEPVENVVQQFIQHTADRLGIEQMPRVHLHNDADWSQSNHSFGKYEPETNELHVNLHGRHLFDILRTTAHELAHARQHEIEPLGMDAGDTGSDFENEAHAVAGIIMRDFADAHPGLFEGASGYIPKNRKEAQMPQYAMALSVDIKPGEVGRQANKLGLKTGRNGEPGLLTKSANLREGRMPQPSQGSGAYRDLNEPLGPETPPTMPKGTVRVDVSDVYDWYKLGQHISNMKGLGRHDFGKGPPSTIFSFGDEETEHQFIKDLEATGLDVTDIDPRDPQQPPSMRRIKTDPTYNVAEDDLVESLRKDFDQLQDELLGEIKMSPSNLRSEAARTGALAGMEFEMIVPGVKDEEPEAEADYDQDERCRSIEDAVQFFDDGDLNGRREIQRLRAQMEEDYESWKMEKIDQDWDSDPTEAIYQYLVNNVDPETIGEIIGEDLSDADGVTKQQAARAAEIVNDNEQQPYYDDARDFHRDENNDAWDESDWLDAEDLDRMSDVESRYQITWPYWNYGSGEMAADIDTVATDFSEAIGMPVNASTQYHGGRREAGHYVVEPDGSLDPDSDDHTGLEFVSPPMPIDEMLDQLKKVREWASRYGCYTNRSTGLHINVSVPEFDRAKLDYVKLALLLGDQYVLDQFGRSSNHYAKSALGKIQAMVRDNPEKAQALLDRMRGHMDDFATRAIHSGQTDKYTSINTKNGYIEFRSPGGDWLDENFDKVENTLLRFTVALSAAMNPEAYREEYLKKLYKLLEPVAQETKSKDTIKYFSDYVAGKIPAAALRSFVKQAQLQRQVAKDPTDGKKYWWRVGRPGYGASVEVVATNREDAIALGKKEYPEWDYAQDMTAEPIRAYQEPQAPATAQRASSLRPTNPDGNFVIMGSRQEPPYYRFMAADYGDADTVLLQYSREHAGEWEVIHDPDQQLGQPPVPGSTLDLQRRRAVQSAGNFNFELSQTDIENRLAWPDQTGDANYEVVNRNTLQPVYLFIANTDQDAQRKYRQIIQAMGMPGAAENYGYRARGSVMPPIRQQPATGGSFTGNWIIQDSQGREIHRFSGVGNVQSDANRVAIQWLRANPGSMQAGVTVVPEMS